MIGFNITIEQKNEDSMCPDKLKGYLASFEDVETLTNLVMLAFKNTRVTATAENKFKEEN